MNLEFLDLAGLQVFSKKLETLFATQADVTEARAKTDPYILDVEYSDLAFNIDQIINEKAGQFNYSTFSNFTLS